MDFCTGRFVTEKTCEAIVLVFCTFLQADKATKDPSFRIYDKQSRECTCLWQFRLRDLNAVVRGKCLPVYR